MEAIHKLRVECPYEILKIEDIEIEWKPNEHGIHYLEIDGISSSFELDIEEKSRSFQDTEITYDEVIMEIFKDYKDFGYTQCMDEPKKTGKPLFQYKETDFDFIKRLASKLGLDLVCDIINLNNMFYFGRPAGENYILEDEINYKAYKNLEKYFLDIKKESGQAGILLENDISCYGDVVRENGSSRDIYTLSSLTSGMGGDR